MLLATSCPVMAMPLGEGEGVVYCMCTVCVLYESPPSPPSQAHNAQVVALDVDSTSTLLSSGTFEHTSVYHITVYLV